MLGVSMSPADAPGWFWNRASKTQKQAPASSLRHNLANHGNLPDLDDVQELLVYLTLLFIVLSWMLREIHVAFFTTGPLLCLNRLCASVTWKELLRLRDYFSQNVRAPSADISCSRSREQLQKPCYATRNAPLSVGGRFALKRALQQQAQCAAAASCTVGMRVSVASVSGKPARKVENDSFGADLRRIRVHVLGPGIWEVCLYVQEERGSEGLPTLSAPPPPSQHTHFSSLLDLNPAILHPSHPLLYSLPPSFFLLPFFRPSSLSLSHQHRSCSLSTPYACICIDYW